MPRNIESIDDQPLDDGTPNFGGGMVSFPPRQTLAANQFFIGQNTMLTKAGVLQTRRAWANLGSLATGLGGIEGLGYLDTAAGVTKLLALFNGAGTGTTVSKSYDGSTWTALGYTATAGQRFSIVQGIDKLYLSNGGANMYSWDGTTFVDLGSGATDAPKAKFLVWGTNRLIAAGVIAAPDTVYFSDILDPSSTHWSASNRIRVGAGDGEPITGLSMFSKTLLVVFKRRRTFIVDINPSVSVSQFVIDEVPGSIGCVAHRTIARVGKDLFFLSDEGVRSLARVLQGEDQQVSAPISLPIADQVAGISPWSYTEEYSAAVYFNGRYFLTLFINTAPTSDPAASIGLTTLSYNVELGVWEGRWTGFSPRVYAITRFSGQPRVVLGGNGGDVMYWRHDIGAAEVAADFVDDAYPATTADIATRIGLRSHTYGSDRNVKRGSVVEVEFETSTATSATVKAIDAEGTSTTLNSVTPSGRVPLTLLHQAPSRDFAFEISSTAKKLAVRRVSTSAFLQTMPVGT